MAKDGKRYFQCDRQIAIASQQAIRGRTPGERESLKVHWLKKLVLK